MQIDQEQVDAVGEGGEGLVQERADFMAAGLVAGRYDLDQEVGHPFDAAFLHDPEPECRDVADIGLHDGMVGEGNVEGQVKEEA